MSRPPNTAPLTAPNPAAAAMAAPAPKILAAACMPLEMALVWKLRLRVSEVVGGRGLPSCCGSHLSVPPVILALLQTVIGSVV